MGIIKSITERWFPPAAPAGLNMSEFATLLLEVSPELRETYTRADIELALDDRGWLTTRNQLATTEFDAATRMSYINKARMYWLKDPLAKQAVRLWTDYAMGTGISYTCDNKEKQAAIDKFMKHRKNRRLLSSEGQRKSSKKLLIDGEVFFAFFTEKDGSKTVRTIDPIQITHVITDPEDSEHILGYRRAITDATGQQKAIYYPDWTCDEADRALANQQKCNQEQVNLTTDAVVYHLPFDSINLRGNGLLSCIVDWAKEHRRFMQARVAIVQALSKYAHKITTKGGQAQVNAIKAKLESTYATTTPSTVERNPVPAAGGTWVQNDGLDLQAVPKATGAGDAATDGNQLKLMVSAGVGIMLHYFGDPSTGNLATATAMELPMLKMFESYQELWKDAYRDIFAIVLDENLEDGVDEADDLTLPAEEPPDPNAPAADETDDEICIDLPPILADDLTALGSAMTSFANVWPELADDDDILTIVLTAMRVPDVDETLKSMRKAKEARQLEQQANQEKMATLMGGAAPKDPAKAALAAQQMAKETADLTAALVRVAEAMEL